MASGRMRGKKNIFVNFWKSKVADENKIELAYFFDIDNTNFKFGFYKNLIQLKQLLGGVG